MEVSARLVDIASNLLPQNFDGRKLDLVAQALQKADLDLRLRREFDGMEIEQVGLDGEKLRPEGWTIPHIRNRIESLRAHPRAGNVDAVLGDQFFVAGQVDGRHRIFR